MTNFKAGWHLIYTRPKHEKAVDKRLSELNIRSYLPTKRTLRNWHDRRRYVDEPLFPSYVFIYLNDMQNYYDGMDTDGVLYYVRTGKEIATVSEAVIDNIRLVAGQAKELEVSEGRFVPGCKVEITQGALTGLSCEVVHHNCKRKLLVRVELLKRNILVSVPDDYLIAV